MPSSHPPPHAAIQHLESAARTDLSVARTTLGLFGTITGSDDGRLFPGYSWAFNDLNLLPRILRTDARTIIEWASKRRIELNEVVRAQRNITSAVMRMRRESRYGRRRIRIARALQKEYPVVRANKHSHEVQAIEVLSKEIGHPIGSGTIRRLKALQPVRIEICDHTTFGSFEERTVSIRLRSDGYSIDSITIAVALSRAVRPAVVEGVLEDYFETGTEGLVWSVYADDERGYDALHTIKEGDHLTISDQLGNRLWAGKIKCDRKAGWKRYPQNPKHGQPSALGFWIHWTQQGFTPDEWAKLFVRRGADRLRGILRKRSTGDSSENGI